MVVEQFSETAELTEHELTLPRVKRRLLLVPAAYALMRVGRILLGKRRLLRLSLNLSWLMRRFAHELSGEAFGVPYYTASMGLSEELLAQWIPSGGSVLDIGCGTGRWCRIAARHAARVVGIDYSAASIEAARRMATPAHVEYRIGDLTKDLRDERFDVALLIHVLEHIEDADGLLQTIARRAKTVIVEVPDFESDGLNVVRHQLGCPWYADEDHVREYSDAILASQLERNRWSLQTILKRRGMLVAVAVAAVPQEPAVPLAAARGGARGG